MRASRSKEALEPWASFETGPGDFLTADSARSALDAWRAYRDRVLDDALAAAGLAR
ncbi:hypothetical protein ACWGIU_15285 [Streptomyces sp. NPDC054840]